MNYIIVAQIALYVLCCLCIFAVMYEHCVYRKTIMQAVKELSMKLFLSPVAYFIFRTILIIILVYLIYSLIHNTSLF